MVKNFLRRIYISKPISNLMSLLGTPWRGRGAILMYHRILPNEQINKSLDFGMTVSCSDFEKQIKSLRSKYKICSMNEFVNNLKKDKNEFMLAITFDDGYKDNLVYALPILEKFEIPATIYITTKFLNENTEMWWYELSEVIWNNSILKFEYKNKIFKFSLNNNNKKLFAYQNLRKIFLNLKIDKQNELLEKITNIKKRKSYSEICLNSEEVKILDKHPLITVGSHGHNHSNFRILNNEEIKNDVNKSLKILEDLLNHKIKHFCYPYGSKNEASTREYNIIENLNFDSAVSGRTHPIKNYNLYSLPRIYIGKNTCDKTLINHLSGFYNLVKKFS